MIIKFFRKRKERKLRRIELRLQQAYDCYMDVVKSFPDIKEGEIKISYGDKWNDLACYKIGYRLHNKIKPEIIIGKTFFETTKEDQEGIMAHEIGHHERMKYYSLPKIKRLKRLRFLYSINVVPNSRPYWKERLEKWYILNETAANNKVAKTKHGESLLKYYKTSEFQFNKATQKIIENLEQKINGRRKSNV